MPGKKRTKKRNTRKRKRKNQKDFAGFYPEITVLIVSAVCLFLFLANFDLCGKAGRAASSFCFGAFGMVQYLVPLVVFLISLLMISNQGSSIAIKKSAFSLLLLVLAAALFQAATNISESDIQSLYRLGSVDRSGGGVLGGAICSGLYGMIGTAGTYVVILFLILICLILVTERSFFALLKKVTQAARTGRTGKKPAAAKTSAGTRRNAKNGKRDQKLIHEKLPRLSFGKERQEKKTAKMTSVPPDLSANPEDLYDFDSLLEEQEDAITTPPNKKTGGSGASKRSGSKEPVQKVQEPEPVTVTALSDGDYVFPSVSLLTKGRPGRGTKKDDLKLTAVKLQQTLANFGVNVTITDISCGPSVTRFEMQPEQGVKVSKIVGLSDDIKLNLAAPDIRIEAPIPGKAAVGIEVPNKTNEVVMFRDLIENNEFKRFPSNLAFAVGKNLSGKVIIFDIAKMPHLLIAGATGSGKSVCINTLIMSIIYKSSPKDVRLIMIDPKVVELSAYQGIPHLLIPVVTDPKQASSALNWAVMEMGERYKKFAQVNVRNLKGYNEKAAKMKNQDLEDSDFTKLPEIVIIVDELADLMMVAPGEVEDAIVRLSQLARAAGIHLIIATQRPSVNVITGLIKANVPSRIAFSVSSGVDSRTIIDMNGAEKLLGKGDMLFYPSGYQKPVRIQGAFVSDEEVAKVVQFLKSQNIEDGYDTAVHEQIQSSSIKAAATSERDEYFDEAAEFIIDKDKASIASLQRIFKIGFNRAARLMDQLCDAGIVGEEEGTKPRKVLMSKEDFEQYKGENE